MCWKKTVYERDYANTLAEEEALHVEWYQKLTSSLPSKIMIKFGTD
jgi:hypothetical protein